MRARAGQPDSPVRRHVVALFTDAARDFLRAPEAISRGLRNARELSSVERRVVADAVHDLVRLRRRLAFLAGGEDPVALFDEWLAGAIDPEAGDDRIAAITNPVERLGVSLSYPDWIVERLIAAYGEKDAEAIARSMNRRAPLTVRTNRLKGTRAELRQRLAALGIPSSLTKLAPDGLILHTRQNVYSLEPFRDGWMELQDEGSQLVAELVAPPPRGSVIDACAGAGGKTLALGAAMENRGRLVALDVSKPKLEELRRRVARAGLTNVRAVQVGDELPEGIAPASRVLVDAPCSGLGVVRRNPESKWRLQPNDLVELPVKQAKILARYAALVEPGGRLTYATCSLLPEENDRVVDGFLAAHPDFSRVPAKEILGRERALTVGDGEVVRLLPHQHDTDGFFGAVMRRRR